MDIKEIGDNKKMKPRREALPFYCVGSVTLICVRMRYASLKIGDVPGRQRSAFRYGNIANRKGPLPYFGLFSGIPHFFMYFQIAVLLKPTRRPTSALFHWHS